MTQARTDLPALMRGVAGAMLLGAPLVYTQEVWRHGATMGPWVIALLFAVAFAISVALSGYVGVERGRTYRPVEDAVLGAGLSLLLAAGVLLLLRRIDLTMSLPSLAGVIALTSLPMMIGFSIGNALAPRSGGEGAQRMTGTPGEILAAAAGTIVLTLNIAPTEEPVQIAGELTVWHLAAVVLVSLALSYLIVFYAEFDGKEQRRASDGAAQHPVTETALAYLVAVALCGLMLAAFGRFNGLGGVELAAVIVLALPGSLGGALGRMLV